APPLRLRTGIPVALQIPFEDPQVTMITGFGPDPASSDQPSEEPVGWSEMVGDLVEVEQFQMRRAARCRHHEQIVRMNVEVVDRRRMGGGNDSAGILQKTLSLLSRRCATIVFEKCALDILLRKKLQGTVHVIADRLCDPTG